MQRLTQAHVIGEHAAEAIRREVGEEMVAVALIRAHLGANGRRQRRRDARFEFADAALDFFHAIRPEKSLRRVIGKLQCVEALRLGGEILRVQAEPGELFVLLGREVELQASPALFAKAHVAAVRVEEELQFLLRERGVADVEHDLEIKPVHRRFLHVERHAAADRFVAQGGQLLVKQDLDAGREGFEPGDENFGRLPGEPEPPLINKVCALDSERIEQAGKMTLCRAILDNDDAFLLLQFFFATHSRLRLPSVHCEMFRDHARRFGDDGDDDVFALASGVSGFQVAP